MLRIQVVCASRKAKGLRPRVRPSGNVKMDLSDEILLLIFSYVGSSIKEFLHIRAVCKRWYDLHHTSVTVWDIPPPKNWSKYKCIRRVDCRYNNKIESLTIPMGCEWVKCNYNNRLTSLILPKGCIWVDCYANKLKSLILPEGCIWVDCRRNGLESLTVPEGCLTVYASHNRIRSITIPDGCESAFLYQNPFIRISSPVGCKVYSNGSTVNLRN